ncbi:MAG: DUF6364 family protein [Cyanobacteria bacterium J06639_1]
MTAKFNLRLDETLKNQLQAHAERRGKSLNQLLSDYLQYSSLLDKLTDENSQVVIKRAKGYDENQEVVVPSPGALYR